MMSGVSGRQLLTVALLILLVLVSMVIRVGLVSTPSRDFRPSPDAAEYAAAGLSLAEGRGLTLAMGGGAYPTRYPGGYPMLLALFHILGLPLERFHWGSLLLSLAVLPLVHWLARRSGCGRDAALLAAAVTAFSPVLLFCSIRVLAESASLVMLLAAFLLAQGAGRAAGRRAVLLTLLAGAAAGFTVIVRLANLVSLPVIFGLVLWLVWQRQERRSMSLVRTSLLFGLGGLAGILPQLVVNKANFGRLLTTGYGYWNEAYLDPRDMFEAAHAVHPWNPIYGNLWYYLRHLAGMSFETNFLRLYSLAALLLAVAGLFALLRNGRHRAVHVFGLLHCLATLALLLFYHGQSTRLLAPVIPWVALWAGQGFSALWHRPAGAPLRRSCRGAGLLLVLLAVVPLLVWSVSRTSVFHRDDTSGSAAEMALAGSPPGSLIISGLSPVYTGLLLEQRGGREVVQLSRQDGSYVSYLLNASFDGEGPPLPQVRFMPPLAGREPLTPLVREADQLDPWRLRQVSRALETGRPVFVLQEVERPPFSDGHLAVRQYFRLRQAGREKRALLLQVVGVRDEAWAAAGRTPLDIRLRRKEGR